MNNIGNYISEKLYINKSYEGCPLKKGDKVKNDGDIYTIIDVIPTIVKDEVFIKFINKSKNRYRWTTYLNKTRRKLTPEGRKRLLQYDYVMALKNVNTGVIDVFFYDPEYFEIIKPIEEKLYISKDFNNQNFNDIESMLSFIKESDIKIAGPEMTKQWIWYELKNGEYYLDIAFPGKESKVVHSNDCYMVNYFRKKDNYKEVEVLREKKPAKIFDADEKSVDLVKHDMLLDDEKKEYYFFKMTYKNAKFIIDILHEAAE